MGKVFVEPCSEALDKLRGKISPSRANYRNDCDTGICPSCNCNCDDTYGLMAKKVLTRKS